MAEVDAQPSARLLITPRKRAFLIDAGFAVIMFAFIWTAYAPSLKHVHRADQWNFLVDMIPFDGLVENIQHSFSYNRTRLVAPGDVDLFRPVLFVMLATERWAFEGDLGAYQLVGIILHCVICFLLFTLLRQIAGLSAQTSWGKHSCLPFSGMANRNVCPTEQMANRNVCPTKWFHSAALMPYAVTAFFALNPATQELVIWSHLGGYLLFLVFLLGAMKLMLRHVSGAAAGHWRSASLWGCWALLLLSAFTYELGQIAAIFTGLVLALALVPKVSTGRALGLFTLFATVLLLYQGANALDRRAHAGQFVVGHDRELVAEAAFKPATLPRAGRFVVYTLVQPFFPSLLDESLPNDRLELGEAFYTRAGWHMTRKLFGPGAIVSLPAFLLLAGYTLIALRWMLMSRMRTPILVFLFAAVLYGTYAAMTVFGRMNLRPKPGILASNSYYTYVALLFGLMAAFAAWQPLAWSGNRLVPLRRALLIGLLAVTAIGAEQVRRVNLDTAERLDYMAKPIRLVNQFVREHRHEKDFSLAIDYKRSEAIPYRSSVPVTDVVFIRWLNVTTPKYRLAYRYGKVWVLNHEPLDSTPAESVVEPPRDSFVLD